jgi:ubiquitin-like protein Pup
MAAKDTSSQPQTAGRAEDTGEAEVAGPEEASPEKASTEEASTEEAGNPPGDVGEILDDMDEALEENAEEIVRSFVQQGGQ